MIVTRKTKIPWTWIVIAQIPFVGFMFSNQIQFSTWTLSLKKFVDNPGEIAFILSIGQIPSMVLGPLINYTSDRIWTRIGRRKPFLIIGFVLQACTMLLFPFAPNFVVLVGLLLTFQFVGAIGVTFYPITYEVIPPSQRGMGQAIQSVLFWSSIILFYSMMVGRFNDVYFMGPLESLMRITGEQLTYWIAGPFLFIVAFVAMLGIKEILPAKRETLIDPSTGKRLGPLTFLLNLLKDVFSPQWLVLYLLMFVVQLQGLGLQSFQVLLYSEQWGYTNQQYGFNVAIGAIIMIPFTFLTGLVSDKFDKMKIYQYILIYLVAMNLAYIFFVKMVLPDHRPALWQIVMFGEMISVATSLAAVVTYPLFMEYVPRNKMGTVNAGMGIVTGFFAILIANISGFWITTYSEIFCPRPGSSTQVVFNESMNEKNLRSILASSPGIGVKAKELNLSPFFYPGYGGKESSQWVIRDFNPESGKRGKERKDLDMKRSQLQKSIDEAKDNNKAPDQEKVARLETIKSQIAVIDSQLSLESEKFKSSILGALGKHLVVEGEQLKSARWSRAALVTIPSSKRVTPNQVTAVEQELEKVDPDVIDVLHLQSLVGDGIISADGPQGVILALRVPTDSAPVPLQTLSSGLSAVSKLSSASIKDETRRDMRDDAIELATNLIPAQAKVTGHVPLFALEVPTLEEAHATQASDIAASLRIVAERGVRIDSVPSGKGLSLAAVFYKPLTNAAAAPALPTEVVTRFARTAQGQADSAVKVTQISLLYDQEVKSAAGEYLTIPRPVVSASFKPQKYDYFSAYMLTVLGTFIGFLITILVKFFENKGVIKKLGLLEDGIDPNAPRGKKAKEKETR